jgi:hypothetical protein
LIYFKQAYDRLIRRSNRLRAWRSRLYLHRVVCSLSNTNRLGLHLAGGGENMVFKMDNPFLGRILIDPKIVNACDSGKPYIQRYRQS